MPTTTAWSRSYGSSVTCGGVRGVEGGAQGNVWCADSVEARGPAASGGLAAGGGGVQVAGQPGPVRVMEEGSCAAALLNARAGPGGAARRGARPEWSRVVNQAAVQACRRERRRECCTVESHPSHPSRAPSPGCRPPMRVPTLVSPHLLLGLQLLLLQLLDLARKHGLGRRRGVDARRLREDTGVRHAGGAGEAESKWSCRVGGGSAVLQACRPPPTPSPPHSKPPTATSTTPGPP